MMEQTTSLRKISGYPMDVNKLIISTLTGFVFAALLLKSVYLAGVFLVGVFVLANYSTSPLRALSLIIFLVPYSHADFVDINLLGVMGSKPLHILLCFVLFVSLINVHKAKKMPRYALIFITVMFVFFTVNFLRSTFHLDYFAQAWLGEISLVRYSLTHYVKGLIFFVPFIMIVKFVKTSEDLEYVMKIITLSLIFLSFFILYLYLFQVADKGNFVSVRGTFISVLGMHTNSIANFYILAFPVILVQVILKKDFLSTLGLIIIIPVIGLLYSRAAYGSLIFATVFYFVISKRKKYLPLVLGFLLILLMSSSFNTIKDRILTDIHTKNINKITAGRSHNIWLPLVDEYAQDSRKMLIGNGRYSITSSRAHAKGYIKPGHPHNMYLELILDSGFVGFCIIMSLYVVFIMRIKRSLRWIKDMRLKEYQYAVLVAIITFLFSGLVGRSFYPQLQNAYLWIILGISVAIMKLQPVSGGGYNAET